MAESKVRFADELRLKPGVSLSQTRFALANFCLNNFGGDGQYFADVIELCSDINRLQEALNAISSEVHSRCPDSLPALVACVREANETDVETSRAAATAPPPAPDLGAGTRGLAAQVPEPAGNTAAASVGAVPPRGTAASQPPRGPSREPLRLEPGVSLAQTRFALSEFCLNLFGARGQPLVDGINRCADLSGLQKILGRIGVEVQERHPDRLAELSDCVREINDTSG